MQMENYTRDMPQTPPIGLDLTFPPQELQSGTPWLDSIIFFFHFPFSLHTLVLSRVDLHVLLKLCSLISFI